MAPIETQQPTEFLGEKSKKNVILLRAFTNMFLYVHLLSLSLSLSHPLVIHHHHHPLRFYSSPLFL
jgi:hypothetical protein